MTYEQLLKELRKGTYHPIYFLHGNEPYFIDRIASYIEEHALSPAEQAFNRTILYGKDVSYVNVVDYARRYPMMATRQVVIIKEAQTMKDLPKLVKYLENPTETTVLVLCYKHKRLDGRTAFAKTLKKRAIVCETKRLYDNQLPDWIGQYLEGYGYTIQPTACQIVANHLGADLAKISNELDKLRLNLPKETTITSEHIHEYIGISKEYNVFELHNALARNDRVRVHHIVTYFVANPKQNPLPKVIGALYNFFSKVYICHFLRNLSDDDLAKALKMRSAWFVRDYKQALRYYSRTRTEAVLALLREYDLRSKGIDNHSTSTPELLRELIYRIVT